MVAVGVEMEGAGEEGAGPGEGEGGGGGLVEGGGEVGLAGHRRRRRRWRGWMFVGGAEAGGVGGGTGRHFGRRMGRGKGIEEELGFNFSNLHCLSCNLYFFFLSFKYFLK